LHRVGPDAFENHFRLLQVERNGALAVRHRFGEQLAAGKPKQRGGLGRDDRVAGSLAEILRPLIGRALGQHRANSMNPVAGRRPLHLAFDDEMPVRPQLQLIPRGVLGAAVGFVEKVGALLVLGVAGEVEGEERVRPVGQPFGGVLLNPGALSLSRLTLGSSMRLYRIAR